MTLDELFKDKALKPKEKTDFLAKGLLEKSLDIETLLLYAQKGKDAVKATCIEALEFATKENPNIATEAVLAFVTQTLTEKAPRVKWESAKVVGNIARLFPTQLDEAVGNLLKNSHHEGTVVRWSAAYALGEILKLRTALNEELLPAVQEILEREEKDSIRKIYLKAI